MANAADRPSNSRPTPTPQASSSSSGWLTVPLPLAWLFKRFPLLTYPPNELPARSPDRRDVPTLYVFISDVDALRGLPSYNPACLKWQTFLKLAGVHFRIQSSNNHASPTGALPFLLPSFQPGEPKSNLPIPSNKLEQYAQSNGKIPELSPSANSKIEVYESLLDHRIRNAWLYSLYLSPANTRLLSSLYIEPVSSSRPVRGTLLYQLRQAAETEILRSTSRQAVDPAALYRDAREAFDALNTVLGSEDEWFFGSAEPGLFDAFVFSYTHLLLREDLKWENKRLTEMLEQFPGLVDHRNRILERCWGSS
ncbi:hypothetical protein F5Y16DRAFT_117097 [Xylariaceae sp. FL0255]|nr:hypothetical protein F5Y16DRAFT_117097 [Xylariaceae sp. FL0255]